MFLELETDFGLSLIRHAPANMSVVVSPLSVIFALAMVEAGAKGRTKSQIDNVLFKGLAEDKIHAHYATLLENIRRAEEGTKTNIANGLFVNKQYHIEEDYARTISKKFAASVRSLDFDHADEAAKIIDGFVSNSTEGKIEGMVTADSLQGIDSLLVNAIHFRAEWLMKFDPVSNKIRTFYSSEGNKRKIEFMTQEEEWLMYAEDDLVEVIALEYQDPTYAFNIILPKARFGLANCRSKLTGKRIQELLGNMTETYFNCSIPKMKIETDFKLKEALVSIGISDMFSETADLTGISKKPPLLVSAASHKAIIEVDEDGTTAAAVTLNKMIPLSALFIKPKVFIADHPFMFVLTKDKSPLFIGQFH
ncbi:hypothetical protein Q1695_004105 [Nippostrongylus brasiliensis]|nr:hypothetical protein Q1695_004105 [Nippostrongylus brasiliensis]